jgi:hypothetical protein
MEKCFRMKAYVLGRFLLLHCIAIGAAEFQNLDFEKGDTSGVRPGSSGPPSKLVPGWSMSSGGYTINQVIFDVLPVDWAFGWGEVHLLTNTNFDGFPVFGKQGLVLIPALIVTPPTQTLSNVDVALTQQGTIPAGTRSLHFIASSTAFSDPPSFFAVWISGQQLPLLWQPSPEQSPPPGSSGAYAVWNVAADVSQFAGKEVELTIETRLQTFLLPNSLFPTALLYYGIDEITFSPVAFTAPDPPHFYEIKKSGGTVIVSWTGAGWLQVYSSYGLGGSWRTLWNGTSPYTNNFAMYRIETYRLEYFPVLAQ